MPLEIAPMATRNVVLTDRQEKLIDTLVDAGRYQNASEVLREGLRLVEQREAEDAAKLAALKEAAKLGMAAVERGEARAFSDAASLRRHLRDVAAKAIANAKRSG
jgi:antitoxin ParD1/3/4